MHIATSIFVAAVGAILRFAVADHVSGVDLKEIGVILLLVGAVGFVIAVIAEFMNRQHVEQRTVEGGGAPPVRERICSY